LDPLTKAKLWLAGTWHCCSWAFKGIWDNYLVDLHPNKIPWHPDDFISYAERWNGRIAMLAVITILQLELIYKISIWELIHVL
jgi:hypothetical protein